MSERRWEWTAPIAAAFPADDVVRRARLGLTAAFAALALFVASAVVWSDPAAPAAGERFIDPVFESVDVTSDIPYRTAPDEGGDPVDLALDIYEPAGDTATNRPLVLWMFGGGFVSGAKDGPLEQIMGSTLASRGYVVASIDYRVSSATDLAAIVRAYEDARASLAWLREHAEDYGIDPDRVVSSGMSAGAVTALNAAYAPNRANGEGTADDPSHVDAVLSFAGVTVGTIETGEPPAFMAHGTADNVVPFALAESQCQTANSVGVECILDAYPGFGHVDVLGNLDEILSKSLPWLHGHLDLDAWSAEVAPPSTTAPIAPDAAPTPPAAPTSLSAAPPAAASPAAPAAAVTRSPSFTG